MKKNLQRFMQHMIIPALIFILCTVIASGADFTVTSFDQNSSSVGRLEKYEVSFTLSKTWTNPYDNIDNVEVNAYFTLRGRDSAIVPGFWYEGFTRGLTDTVEYLAPSGINCWKIRFAPKVIGNYTFYLQIIDRTNGDVLRYPSCGTLSFSCIASSNKGFLKVSAIDKSYLQYEDGGLYIGIGHNLCGWEWGGTSNSRGTYDYDDWLTNMANNKANLTQFDFCEGNQLEWTNNSTELPYSSSWQGLGKYNQQTAWKMDYRMDKATQLGIFYRISLSHWEDFDNQTENFPHWGWSRNPYYSANGGPVSDVSGFFTNSIAKGYYKKYLRYIVARWGYSKNILAYELWNEVDSPLMIWGSGQTYFSNTTNIANWHSEMAAYLKQLDPIHLVTTSFADSPNQPSVWALTDIDITTIHRYTYYNSTYGWEQFETENCIGDLIQSRSSKYTKPVLIGEFALSPGGDIQKKFDLTGIAFHNQLWSSIMQRGMATAMHWTWGSYIHKYNLYYHYKPIGEFFAGEDITNMQIYKTYNNVARSYGLKTWSKAYIWVQDIKHTFIDRTYPDNIINGQVVNLTIMDDGTYLVSFYDTYTGNVISTTTLTCASGKLVIPVPNFTKDIAIKVNKISGHNGNLNYAGNPGFEAEAANQTPSAWSTWPGQSGNDWDAFYSEALTPHTGTNRGTHYKNSAYEVYTYQIITGIPNGMYTFSAWVISSSGQNAKFIKAENYGSSTYLRTNIPTTSTWTKILISNIPVTNGQCTIGFYSNGNAGNWLGFDDVEFVQTANPNSVIDSKQVETNVTIYPNPVTNNLFIKNALKGIPVQVYSLQGQKLIDHTLNNDLLYVGELCPSEYILKINNQVIKFIKK